MTNLFASWGSAALREIAARRVASESSVTETALFSVGDLSVTVDASGSLVSPDGISPSLSRGGGLKRCHLEIVDRMPANHRVIREDAQKNLSSGEDRR